MVLGFGTHGLLYDIFYDIAKQIAVSVRFGASSSQLRSESKIILEAMNTPNVRGTRNSSRLERRRRQGAVDEK